MIYLAPIKDKDKIMSLFNSKGISFSQASQCVEANDKGEVLGYSLFDLDKEKIVVHYIEPINDIPLADGILRSTLHVATEHSVMNAFYANTLSEDFLAKIGFIKNKDEKALDIDKLFKSCCNCK